MDNTKQIAIQQFDIKQIYEVTNLEEIMQVLEKVDVLKTVLNAAKTFREQSVKFAMLEAETLVRVVELGGLSKLRGNRKKAAMWLYGLDKSQRDLMIAKCKDGKTIDNVWKDEVGKEEKHDKLLETLRQRFGDAEDELNENGVVHEKNIFFGKEKYDILSDKILREHFKDKKRKLEFRADAVVNDFDGAKIYVKKPKNTDEEIKGLLLEWFERYIQCIENLNLLYYTTDIAIKEEEIVEKFGKRLYLYNREIEFLKREGVIE